MGQRASNFLDIDDRWAALQLDGAVTLIGRAIENALQEQYNTGGDDDPKWENKYTLMQILDPEFRFSPPPKPLTERQRNTLALRAFQAWGRKYDSVNVSKG